MLTPTELLLAGKIDLGYGFRYAFGFFDTRDESGDGWVGHGGGPGMNGDLLDLPEVRVRGRRARERRSAGGTARISDYLDPRLPR